MIVFKVFKNYQVNFLGHSFSIIEINNKFASLSAQYNRFIDFELVNMGFDIEDIRKLHTDGQLKGENFVCYDNRNDAVKFIQKLIVEFVTNHSDWIEVVVPQGEGFILKGLCSKYNIKSRKLSNGTYLVLSNNKTNLNIEKKIKTYESGLLPYENDSEMSILDIRVNRKRKLNIDFTE